MPDKFQSDRIICEGGLDSTANHINLSLNKPGAGSRLVNYEVGLEGGYSKLLGYTPYSEFFPVVGGEEAEGPVLGVIIFENSVTEDFTVFAARKNAADTNYKIYEFQMGDGWVDVAPGFTLTATGVTKLRYDVGNDGFQNYLAIADGINPAILFDGTDWTQIKSTNTGSSMASAGGNQVVNAPSLVRFFMKTLFLGGDVTAKGVVTYSAPNAYYDFTAASGGGQLVAGFAVVQIKAFRSNLYLFGKNAISYAIADVTSGFLVEPLTTDIGCVAADSVVEVGGSLIFLAPDGFRPVAGTEKINDIQLESISKPIHSLLRTRISAGFNDYVTSVVIRGKSQFRLFFSNPGQSQESSRGLLGALRTSDQQNGWEFAETIGMRVSCATSQYVSGDELVLHGDFDGVVYRQETGGSQNGRDMLAVYSTPYLDFGDTEVRKTFEKLTVFLKSNVHTSFTLNVEYDWGDQTISNPSPFISDIESSVTVYGDGSEYGDGSSYGESVHPKALTGIEGSFFSTKITITNYNSNGSYAIHGLIFEYKLEGRR